jgi:hypothetical protein
MRGLGGFSLGFVIGLEGCGGFGLADSTALAHSLRTSAFCLSSRTSYNSYVGTTPIQIASAPGLVCIPDVVGEFFHFLNVFVQYAHSPMPLFLPGKVLKPSSEWKNK